MEMWLASDSRIFGLFSLLQVDPTHELLDFLTCGQYLFDSARSTRFHVNKDIDY